MGSLAEKFASFGWDAVDVDGHDHDLLRRELLVAGERPRVLIAHTVKGKGIDFMEDELMWHYRSFKEGEREAALAALEAGARL
jgi:transketolase